MKSLLFFLMLALSLQNVVASDDKNSITEKYPNQFEIISADGVGLDLYYKYEIEKLEIKADLVLNLESDLISIASGTLSKENPSITLGGTEDKYTAKVTLKYKVDKNEIEVEYDIVGPIIGEKKGENKFKLSK